jgi:uncharacterized repeat protein (TIGR03843 family)
VTDPATDPGTAAATGPGEDGLVVLGRILPASNATFLAELGDVRVVYKPIAGERPLWDFPEGTLAAREVAAYAVSEATGWDVVPPTWLGEGPHGPGMVQEWREPDPDRAAVDVVAPEEIPAGWKHVFDGFDAEEHPVALVHEDTQALRRMAVFDVVVNNADRKGGHVLAMADGHRYGVDHGVSFHQQHKLRTVLWGWMGESLTDDEIQVVQRLAGDEALAERLARLLTEEEREAFRRRCSRLLSAGVLPLPHPRGPMIPWPPF